jgi:hypothetical protein
MKNVQSCVPARNLQTVWMIERSKLDFNVKMGGRSGWFDGPPQERGIWSWRLRIGRRAAGVSNPAWFSRNNSDYGRREQ